MCLTPLMEVCQWWHWMKEARSESLGAHQLWDLVKWSLVTLCSTGKGEPPLTPLAQCLALVQPHTPSPTSILVQCMKWELHQWALLDRVDSAVGVGSKLQLTTVSKQQSSCSTNCLSINSGSLLHMRFTCQEQIADTVYWYSSICSWILVPMFLARASEMGDIRHDILYRAHSLSELHHFL